MKATRIGFISSPSLALFLFLISPAWGQIDIGDYTISGQAEIGGLPMNFTGDRASFEQYRDVPANVIVPQLQLIIGGKKEDYYLNFDSDKTGLNDQSYSLRVGKYGLLDMEFTWDQIPHWFSSNVAQSPYAVNQGHTTFFTLSSKPTATTATTNCVTSPLCQWLNSNAQPLNLDLYNGIGRFNIRYTPTPGWTFTGGYWSNHNVGSRAFGTLFGTSPGSFNITELAEPIDYQTHNIELGAEYAGHGWSLGFKYNGSIFNNLHSNIVWDNPMNLTGVGSACLDSTTLNYNTGTGACRGRLDLYPNNQAHTFSLSGTAQLPYKSNFMGTVSYGWRFQNDSFLPFTINKCYTTDPSKVGLLNPKLTGCSVPLVLAPTISNGSLGGDVRPLLVNATLVNNFFSGVNLKAFYRYYDLSNRSNQIILPQGFINLDTGAPTGASESDVFSYSKNSLGAETGYDFTRWLSAKLTYGWDLMHRTSNREVITSNEFGVGPIFDIKPSSNLLFRLDYRYLSRQPSTYQAAPDVDTANISRKFDEAGRGRNKSSLYAQYSPWDQLMLYSGFEFTKDQYYGVTLGTETDNYYSPSVGFNYTPLQWLRLFGDYNWSLASWRLNTQDRTATTQTPATNCFPAVPAPQTQCWNSRGVDRTNTVSLGSDMDLIEKILGLRLQFTYSNGTSLVYASGDRQSTTPASNYPPLKNQWFELLVRFEYNIAKNLALKFGYYFNHATEKDFGVDIMQPWMGNVDVVPTPNANTARSMFLGDQVKGPFTANVGFITLGFKF